VLLADSDSCLSGNGTHFVPAVALTVPQWAVASLALVVGLVGLGLMTTGDRGTGGVFMAFAGMTLGLLVLTNPPGEGGGG
jgi:hypothetical protein